MEPWEFEALEWLRRNPNKNALAANRFGSTQEAIEAVKRLYAAGATIVKVGPVRDDQELVRRMGGPYADFLTISFPLESKEEILAVAKSIHPDKGARDSDVFPSDKTGMPTIRIWWD